MESQAAVHSQVSQLCHLLGSDFTAQLSAALGNNASSSGAFLRLEASVCSSPGLLDDSRSGSKVVLVRRDPGMFITLTITLTDKGLY